jgi:hypothetical protein
MREGRDTGIGIPRGFGDILGDMRIDGFTLFV